MNSFDAPVFIAFFSRPLSSSSWPMLAQNAIMSALYFSLIQESSTEVSRPPEYAKTIFIFGDWKGKNWCQPRFSPAFFCAGSQNHVRQNLAPENSTAAGGIIRQWRSPFAVLAGAFAFGVAEGAFLQIFQQPTGNFQPLLRGQLL